MTGLSERHARFVAEYVVDLNAAAAARRAGLSPRSAAGLMARADIRAEIERQQEAIAAETKVTIASLVDEAESARQVAHGAGNAAAMVAAITLKAKLTGKLQPENAGDMAREEAAERQAQQETELRRAGKLLADAAESLGLPPDATPAQIVGAVAQTAICSPAAFEVLREAQKVRADAG